MIQRSEVWRVPASHDDSKKFSRYLPGEVEDDWEDDCFWDPKLRRSIPVVTPSGSSWSWWCWRRWLPLSGWRRWLMVMMRLIDNDDDGHDDVNDTIDLSNLITWRVRGARAWRKSEVSRSREWSIRQFCQTCHKYDKHLVLFFVVILQRIWSKYGEISPQ